MLFEQVVVAILHAHQVGKAGRPVGIRAALVQNAAVLHHHGIATSLYNAVNGLHGGIRHLTVKRVWNDDGRTCCSARVVHTTHPIAYALRLQQNTALTGSVCPDLDLGRIAVGRVRNQQGDHAIGLAAVHAFGLAPNGGTHHQQSNDQHPGPGAKCGR